MKYFYQEGKSVNQNPYLPFIYIIKNYKQGTRN
jgi:hypothetical protein